MLKEEDVLGQIVGKRVVEFFGSELSIGGLHNMLNSVKDPKPWLTLTWIGIGLLALLLVFLLARRLGGMLE